MRQALEIRVNGQNVPLGAATIADLLAKQAFEINQCGIAVALNGSVIPRSVWGETALRPGDNIEIVRAKQGG